MASREVRIGRMESFFRDVNERIAESAARLGARRTEFVCECADPACAERVETSLRDYEAVRSDATTFLLAEGHESQDVERVVERRRGFQVVRKVGALVAGTARRLDPRAQPAPEPQ